MYVTQLCMTRRCTLQRRSRIQSVAWLTTVTASLAVRRAHNIQHRSGCTEDSSHIEQTTRKRVSSPQETLMDARSPTKAVHQMTVCSTPTNMSKPWSSNAAAASQYLLQLFRPSCHSLKLKLCQSPQVHFIRTISNTQCTSSSIQVTKNNILTHTSTAMNLQKMENNDRLDLRSYCHFLILWNNQDSVLVINKCLVATVHVAGEHSLPQDGQHSLSRQRHIGTGVQHTSCDLGV